MAKRKRTTQKTEDRVTQPPLKQVMVATVKRSK